MFDTKVADPYAWVKERMEHEFGKENVIFQRLNFDQDVGIGATNGKIGQEMKRHAFIIRELRCLHDFKKEGELGYMNECADNPDLHELFDINKLQDKERFLDINISEMKELLGSR